MSTFAPKVSVCVLAYNHEGSIGRAIEGVLLQQTPFEIEVLVGDDASSDETRAVAEGFATQDRRVRVLRPEPNLGAPRNFARLMRAARGQYVALLEGDDRWTSTDKLARQVDFLDRRPDHAGIYHAVRWISPEGETIRVGPAFKGPMNHSDLVKIGSNVPASAFMFRNALPDPLPPVMFVSRIMADWQLSLIVSRLGTIGYLDEPMSEYVVGSNEGAFSALPPVARLEETARVIAAIEAAVEAGDRALIASHRAYVLFQLASAYAAEGDLLSAARVGREAARLPSQPEQLSWRTKRVQLGHIAIGALSSADRRVRAAAVRLVFTRHRVLR